MPTRGGIRGVLLLCAAAHAVAAQPRPGLAGSWQATREAPSTVAAAPSAIFGDRFAIALGEQSVELTRMVRDHQQPFVTSHRTDGSESRIMSPSRTCLGQTGQIVTTAWEGNSLVYSVVGSTAAGSSAPTPAKVRYAFRLQGPDALVVESVMRTSASAGPTPVGTVYRRMQQALPGRAVEEPARGVPATISQVAWIAGNWSGTRGPATIEERWTAGAGGAMIAMSRTIEKDAITEFEFLCIAERDGSLVYSAMPNAAAPTHFMLTSIDARTATFENTSNDFPKKIQYALTPDGTLEATISGTPPRRPITFSFKRQP